VIQGLTRFCHHWSATIFQVLNRQECLQAGCISLRIVLLENRIVWVGCVDILNNVGREWFKPLEAFNEAMGLMLGEVTPVVYDQIESALKCSK
jgi:hypothetical protein